MREWELGLVVTDLLWTAWSMHWSRVTPQLDWESSRAVQCVCEVLPLHCGVCVCFISFALVRVCCRFSPTAPARPAHTHTLQIIAHVSSRVISKMVSGLQLKSLAGHLYVSNGVITEVALHVMGQLFLKHLFLCVTFQHAGVNWDRAEREPVNQVCFVIRWVF